MNITLHIFYTNYFKKNIIKISHFLYLNMLNVPIDVEKQKRIYSVSNNFFLIINMEQIWDHPR